jgi:phosphohistidine phosphatase
VSAAQSRTLWLVRHAKAVADPPPGGDDFDRVLAPRGRRDAEALGHLIGPAGKGLGLGKVRVPQVALVSPAARTAATADLVLGGMGVPTRQERPDDLYGAEPDEVLAHMRLAPDDVRSLMVVGHNPTAHALAEGLISSGDTKGRDLVVRRGFPTCALGLYRLEIAAWAELDARCATLLGLFIPPFAKP